MEPALALALVLAGFAAALAATIAKLVADVCAAGDAGDEDGPPAEREWVAVRMPGGTVAVARRT